MNHANRAGSSAPAHCLNCNAALAPAQAFCGSCGQKSSVGRLTLGQVAQDFLHVLTHVDHSIFSLIRGLLLHPGRVTREYLDGRRKKHFGPLAFLIISMGLASFIILVTDVQWFEPVSRSDTWLGGLLQRHINLVVLLQFPLLAGVCALFFFRERLHYAEHMVFIAYTSGIRCLFFALVATPAMYFSGANSADERLVIGYYLLWGAYFAFAVSQFYRGNRAWSALKGLIAAAISQGLVFYLVYFFMYLSARFVHHGTS